jgi:biotin synthase-like enzyme
MQQRKPEMTEDYRFILEKAMEQMPLSQNELVTLLSLEDPEDREELFSASREVREKYNGKLIYAYGFVYLSTICRNDCVFCSYRKTNPNSLRYRKTKMEVIEAAKSLAMQGVNLIDLTMGEDPEVEEETYLKRIATLISEVAEETNMPVMISPGLVSPGALKLFRKAGALWYACYQETHSPSLFELLRTGQSYNARWEIKKTAKNLGLMVEDGVLCGVGENPSDLANSILKMKELGAHQVRAMAFVPPVPFEVNDMESNSGKNNTFNIGHDITKSYSENLSFIGINGKNSIDNGNSLNSTNRACNKSCINNRAFSKDTYNYYKDHDNDKNQKASKNGPNDAARDRELSMIAVLRLIFPDALIPASLDVEGIEGVIPRLNAGANLITSFVPRDHGLAGVAQIDLDINNEGRSLPSVIPLLATLGLSVASPDEYLGKVKMLA